MDYILKMFGECFQVLCLYLAKIMEKRIKATSPCENSLDNFLLVCQEHFACEGRYLIIISAKF